MLWIAKPTTRNDAEGERAGRVGRADQDALAEVVQADPDRDQRRELEPGGALASVARSRRASHPRVGPGEQQIGRGRAEQDERRPAECLRPGTGDLEALEQRVDAEEGEQADREREQASERSPARTAAASGNQSIPIATGITPT